MFYLLLLTISIVTTYLLTKYFNKERFLSDVNERSSHTVPTPHGGGIAIAITWFIGLFYLYMHNQIPIELFLSLLGGLLIVILGFVDDMFDIDAKIRLLMQVLVSIYAISMLGGLKGLDLFVLTINNQLLLFIFATLLTVWFINLYNFLDGLNGYAGSEALFLSVAGLLLYNEQIFLVMLVAVLGFLFWNFGNKAKIFMGDSGSTLLGYNVAIFTIYYTNLDLSNMWIWLILFSVFWFDATITLYRRIMNREKLSTAHKKHAYQRLNQSGWSHLKVSVYLYIVNFLLFAIVYLISDIKIAIVSSTILLILTMKLIDQKKAFS